MDASINIVLCGPESCGKSTLGKALAADKHGHYIPEYARIYLETHGSHYSYQSLDALWQAHLLFQKSQRSSSTIQLLDTDLLHYQIWFEEVYGRCPNALLNAIAKEKAHRYLLFYPDIPWEADPLRENPNDRMHLFERYSSLLTQLKRPFEIVKGSEEARYTSALSALEKLQKL